MPCCCLNILNLCDKPVCGVLTIAKEATGLGSGAESGDLNNYTLVLDYFQTQVTLTEEQTEGENIHFDISGLNENYQYTGQIYDSAGNLVTITEGETEYNCIKFKTIINIGLNVNVASELLGPELITNGGFSGSAAGWSLGTWIYSANRAVANAGDPSILFQPGGLTNEQLHRVSFTMTGTIGFISIGFGNSVVRRFLAGNRNVSFDDYYITGDSKIEFQPEGGFDGSITNVSVKEIL